MRGKLAIVVAGWVLATSLATAQDEESTLVGLVRLLDDHAEATCEFGMAMGQIKGLFASFETFPDAESIKRDSAEAAAAIRKLAVSADAVRAFLAKNAEALKAAGLEPTLSSVPKPDELRRYLQLADAVEGFAAGVVQLEFAVYAREDWQRSDISAKTGDVIFVRSEGLWLVSPKLPQVGGTGWNAGERSQLTPKATPFGVKTTSIQDGAYDATCDRGCLLMRIRGQEKPCAPVGMKAVASAEGALEFRANDKDLANNSGICKATVVVVDTQKLKAVGEACSRLSQQR